MDVDEKEAETSPITGEVRRPENEGFLSDEFEWLLRGIRGLHGGVFDGEDEGVVFVFTFKKKLKKKRSIR